MQKLPQDLQSKAWERLDLLHDESASPLLNDHALHAPYDGYRSINITGDYRLIYRKVALDAIELHAIGTHAELYGQ